MILATWSLLWFGLSSGVVHAQAQALVPDDERTQAITQPPAAPRLPGLDLDGRRAWSARDGRVEPTSRSRPAPRQAAGDYPGAFDRPPVFHWRIELPGSPLNSVTHSEYSRPVILGSDVLMGSAKGRGLYRFSRSGGTLLQVYPAGAAVQGEALIVDDRVYFSDTDGGTWCYTLAGELLWTWRGTAPILVRPTWHEGLIYVTNVDDLAVALNADTGELVWRYQARRDLLREAELRLYAAPPAVPMNDVVILGFSDGSLVGVDRITGEERWSRRVGEGRYPDIVAAPVPWQDDLFASSYFEPFVAMDLESQVVRWRADVGGAFGVVVDDRTTPAMVYHPGSDGRLRAYSALTGAERWTWNSGTTGAITAPVVTEAGLVVGTSEGGVHLVDAATGQSLWSFDEPYRLAGMSAPPAVEGRQLLFVTNSGHLYSMLVPRPTQPMARLWPLPPSERAAATVRRTRGPRVVEPEPIELLPTPRDFGPAPLAPAPFEPAPPADEPPAPMEPTPPADEPPAPLEPGDEPATPDGAEPPSDVEPEAPEAEPPSDVEPAAPEAEPPSEVEPEAPEAAPAEVAPEPR